MAQPALKYYPMNPSGFENIHTMIVNLQIARRAMDNLALSSLVPHNPVGPTTAMTAYSSPYAALIGAKDKFERLLSLPVQSIRDITAFTSLLTELAPLLPNPTELGNTLSAVIETTWATPNIEAATAGCKEVKNLLQTSALIANQILESVRRYIGLQRTLAKAEDPYERIPSDTTKDLDAPINIVLADIARSVIGVLPKTGNDTVLKDFFSLSEIEAEVHLQTTSYRALYVQDSVAAQKLTAELNDYAQTVKLVLNDFDNVALAVSRVSDSIRGLSIAMSNVRSALITFKDILPTKDGSASPQLLSAVEAWKIVGNNANSYLQELASPGSVVMKPIPKIPVQEGKREKPSTNESVRTMGEGMRAMAVAKDPPKPTQEQVRDAFGPPSYAEATLPDMAAGTGKIMKALNEFLSLPFINELKVTNSQGAESNVWTEVAALRTAYSSLQDSSIPVVRDIYSMAVFQQHLLPTINQPDGVPLTEFLAAQSSIVQEAAKKARGIAVKTSDLKLSFQKMLDQMQKNLVEVQARIGELKKDLSTAEAEYKEAWVAAVIEGIAALVFTVIALACFATGVEAPIGIALGMAAGASLIAMIKDAAKAGDLAKVIANLEALISSCEQTKDHLEKAIPLFTNVVQMMNAIAQIWEDISTQMKTVSTNYQIWQSPQVYSQAMLEPTLRAWITVQDSSMDYIQTIAQDDSTGATLRSIPVAKVPLLKGDNFGARAVAPSLRSPNILAMAMLPNFAGVAKIPRASFVLNSVVGDVMKSKALNYFSAPKLNFILRVENLTTASERWQGVAGQFNGVEQTDLGTMCQDISTLLHGPVTQSMGEAVNQLLQYTRAQPAIPDLPINDEQWNRYVQSRSRILARGKALTNLADSLIRQAQNDAHNTILITTARMKELEIEMQRRQQELNDKNNRRSELEKFTGGILGGFGAFGFGGFGLGGIIPGIGDVLNPGGVINELHGLIPGIHELENLMRLGENRATVFRAAIINLTPQLEMMQTLFQSTGEINAFWSAFSTDVVTADTLTIGFKSLQAQELEICKATWQLIETSLAATGWT